MQPRALPEFLRLPTGTIVQLGADGGPFQDDGDGFRTYHYSDEGGVDARLATRTRPFTLFEEVASGGWKLTGPPLAIIWSATVPESHDVDHVRAKAADRA